MLVAYRKVVAWVQDEQSSIPVGSRINGTAIRFSFETDTGEVQVYAKNKFIYLVSDDGTGDPAEFDQYTIDLPPLIIPEVEFELEYPSELPAGSNFNLVAKLTNRSEIIITNLGSSVAQLSSGTPPDLFHFNRCQSICTYVGEPEQLPGETTIWNLGDFFYDNNVLAETQYDIESFSIQVRDAEFRTFQLAAGSPAVRIHVAAPPGGELENPIDRMPDREPFQYTSLASPDDYLLINDPNTGYDWIRLDATKSVPVPEMLELLNTHPLLEGFDIARLSQVEQLILNFVHSSGVESTAYQLRNPGEDLNFILFAFLDAIGRTNGPFPFFPGVQTGGAVADKPIYTAFYTSPMTVSWVHAYQSSIPGIRPRHGLNQRVFEVTEKDNINIGYWLLRTNQSQVTPPTGAVYFNDELILPRVKVGNAYYHISMNFRNEVSGLLQVTDVVAKSNSAVGIDAEFDEETGILDIPELQVQTGRNGFTNFHVQLEYVAEYLYFNFRILSGTPN